MRHALTFLHGFLDYPRGATIAVRDYAGYRAYRAGRAAACRLRRGSRSTSVHRLGREDFSRVTRGIDAPAASPAPRALIDAP